MDHVMGPQASLCLCKRFHVSRHLEGIARELTPYSNGEFVDPHTDCLDMIAGSFLMIVFSCPLGRTFDDFSRSLRDAIAASPWQAPYWEHGSHDSTHACGLLVLCSGAPQLDSDLFSLLECLQINPERTWLCCRPSSAFYSPDVLASAVVASISPDWMNVQHVLETAFYRNREDGEEMDCTGPETDTEMEDQ